MEKSPAIIEPQGITPYPYQLLTVKLGNNIIVESIADNLDNQKDLMRNLTGFTFDVIIRLFCHNCTEPQRGFSNFAKEGE